MVEAAYESFWPVLRPTKTLGDAEALSFWRSVNQYFATTGLLK